MAGRIRRMTDRTLQRLGCQWEHGAYEKTWHEPISKSRRQCDASGQGRPELSLRGRIDRVDFAEEDGSLACKVIDYKQAVQKADLGKVYYGLQLQLVHFI